MSTSASGSMGHMGNMGGLAACSVSDAKPLQFPLAQRRKRRVLFTQAQVSKHFFKIVFFTLCNIFKRYKLYVGTYKLSSERVFLLLINFLALQRDYYYELYKVYIFLIAVNRLANWPIPLLVRRSVAMKTCISGLNLDNKTKYTKFSFICAEIRYIIYI